MIGCIIRLHCSIQNYSLNISSTLAASVEIQSFMQWVLQIVLDIFCISQNVLVLVCGDIAGSVCHLRTRIAIC